MKIGEFAELNHVSTKMLRHYDEIGLLKPSYTDVTTGYRMYDAGQSHYLNWIIILKNLDFSLSQIRDMLSGPVDGDKILKQMILKRIEISSALNETIQKKIEIDLLIKLLEKEGFQMDKKIDLLNIQQESVHEIKKSIPNMEMFLETAYAIADASGTDESLVVFRLDISHFKQVNDDYGYDVGDRVIVACYNIIRANVEKHLSDSAMGRAHGDEFIVFTCGGSEKVEEVAHSIINDMSSFDFGSIGCPRPMRCYIGGLIGTHKTITAIRSMVDQSIEVLNEARKNGPNSVAVKQFN